MNLLLGLDGMGGVKYEISGWDVKTSLDMSEECGNTTYLHKQEESNKSVEKQLYYYC